MGVPEKMKNASTRAKVIASILSAAAAIAGATAGTVEALPSSQPTSLNDGQVAQVRTMIGSESPVNTAGAQQLYLRLLRIESKENTLQTQEAQNNVILKLVLKAVTVKSK